MSFNFNPVQGLRDNSVYPDEPGSEAAAREQIQGLLDQVKTYINEMPVNNDFNSLLATNGFQKLPSGFILQWGQTTVNSTGKDTSFPIVFPTACYIVIPMIWDSGTWNAYLLSKSQTAFGAKTNYTGGDLTMLWVALGK